MKTPLRTPLSRDARERDDVRTATPARGTDPLPTGSEAYSVAAGSRRITSRTSLRADPRPRDLDALRREYRDAALRRRRAVEDAKGRSAPEKSGFKVRRRLRSRLRRGGVLLVLLVGAAMVLYVLTSLLPAETPESAEPRGDLEAPERPAPVRGPSVPSGGTDRGWAAAVARDPSPSLAAPGEVMRFERRVALTFDDGPSPDVTPAILDTLREHDVKATFFVQGEHVTEHPEIVRRIVREGHTLGNHTYTHADLSELSPEQVRGELRATQGAVDMALGYRHQLTLVRPPFGEPYFRHASGLPEFERIMREEKMYPVLWTMDSNDSRRDARLGSIVRSVAEAKLVLDTKENDGVLLLHDTHPATADALPLVISYYKLAGLEFIGVRELLADKYGVEPTEIQADPRSR